MRHGLLLLSGGRMRLEADFVGRENNQIKDDFNMRILRIFALLLTSLLLPIGASAASADEAQLMKDGLHQWPAMGGKLMLVVSSYQDVMSFHRSYSFYFKEAKGEEWNEVAVIRKSGQRAFPWQNAVGGEVTLADGVVVPRPDGIYFVVGDKHVGKSYYDKGDITVTWNKLMVEGDDKDPYASPYRLAPVFTRAYPKSALTVEAVLAREATLRPAK